MWTNYDIEISFKWVHEFNDMLIQGFTKKSSNTIYITIYMMVFDVAAIIMQLQLWLHQLFLKGILCNIKDCLQFKTFCNVV